MTAPSHSAPPSTQPSPERIVRANGVELCLQSFGDRDDPAILLISGGACSMDYWEDEFCQRLASGGRFVIRYDHRDTGRSVSYPAGAPAYTGRDLDEDPVGLLDALGLAGAHLVGLSTGGAIAQSVALRHPDRVASLTLIATSPIVASPGSPKLPAASAEMTAHFAEPPPAPDWTDRAAVIDYVIADERPYLARSRPMDEAAVRARTERILDRTTNIAAAMTNHWLAPGEPETGQLGDIRTPTLVLHGTEDPLFPYAHGQALARGIPGARLIPLERTGHQYPPRDTWDQVIPAILGHTTR